MDKLMNAMADRYGAKERELAVKAYEFARGVHAGQMRLSGKEYVTHPVAAATIVAEMRMPATIIVATLLHDTVEDTTRDPVEVQKELREKFGAEIEGLVEHVTKLRSIKYRGVERYIENLRKMFLAMAEDVRVLFIKFADRISNLKDIDALPEVKARRIALESLELYAPIANRLGMGELRGQLEDNSFRIVNPKEYAWVTDIIKDTLPKRQEALKDILKTAKKDLSDAGIEVNSIHGRVKHVYSLYKKLVLHNRDIEKVYDLVALRIIVPTIADCYATLGVIHARWKPLKGRIKDYVAQPKPNGYQSIHTTVFADGGNIFEIQIRTQEMHDAAEFGVAAHWQYDEAGKRSRPTPRSVKWMKELAKIQKEIQDSKEFLEHLENLKVDVFQNRIFVFTPKGDVIELPEHATPVDFAYAIHTEVGNHATGARVNDEIATLERPLKSGDVVEIITDKNRKSPSADWLKSVKTHGARNKIKAQTKSKITDWIKAVIPGRSGGKVR